jgi:hypothetical protein
MLRRVAAELDRYDDNGRLRASAAPATTSERPSKERPSIPVRANAE